MKTKVVRNVNVNTIAIVMCHFICLVMCHNMVMCNEIVISFIPVIHHA